jgi:repressor LexA
LLFAVFPRKKFIPRRAGWKFRPPFSKIISQKMEQMLHFCLSRVILTPKEQAGRPHGVCRPVRPGAEVPPSGAERSALMQELSKMQRKIYEYIAGCIRRQGYAPSVREIGEAVGLRSPSTVHFHLKHLQEAGYIEKGAGKGRALALAHSESAAPAASEPPAGDQIPIVGNVAAGSPILAEECIEDYLTFDTGGRSSEYFALRVRGESMIGAGILDGDLVVVRRQPEVQNGEITVAMIDGEATVKRFSRRNGHIRLLPENDAYSPIDGTRAQILGKVAAVVRRY